MSARPITVAGTFSVEPIVAPLYFWAETLDVPLDIRLAPYGQVLQQLLDPSSAFHTGAAGINVLLLRLEDCVRDLPPKSLAEQAEHLERTIAEWAQGIEAFIAGRGSVLLVFIAPPSPARSRADVMILAQLEDAFMHRLGRLAGVYCVHHSDVFAQYPVETQHDPASDELGHVPYTSACYAAVATALMRRIMRLVSAPHKVMVVDCDNTLWKGVCGEQLPGELELTEACADLQRMLVRQHAAGTLLCLCSKNDVADVEAVFRNRPDMPLRLEHIISHRINWDDKSDNLVSLARELNLGLESFVFIDDNPVECARVRERCPEVLTLQLPAEAERLARFLRHTWVFDAIARVEDAGERTTRYREHKLREAVRAHASDLEDFLARLELDVRVSTMEPQHVERAAELTARTNQFNLTTIRRMPGELSVFASSEGSHAKVVHVRDRFGDYGLTGVVLLRIDGTAAVVDTFLLSCRVLGRGVEVSVVQSLARWAAERNLETLHFECRYTPRNAPARDFLRRAFESFETRAAEGAWYVVPLSHAMQLSIEQNSTVGEKSSTDAGPSRSPGASSSRWHHETQRWDRAADIARESERRQLARWRKDRERSPSAESPRPHEPPQGDIEEPLATIWADLLAVSRVSRADGFLDLGGNSLLTLRLISRVAQRFAVQLPIGATLRCRSLAEMAQLIATLGAAPITATAEVEEGVV